MKTTLENKILEADKKLRISETNMNWLKSSELLNYLKAWFELQSFYVHNSDLLTVSSFVLSSYLRYTKKLNRMLHDPMLLEYHDQIYDKLISIESSMETITQQAFYKLYPLEGEEENE